MHVLTELFGSLPNGCMLLLAWPKLKTKAITLAMRAVDSLVTLRAINQRDSCQEESVEKKRLNIEIKKKKKSEHYCVETMNNYM